MSKTFTQLTPANSVNIGGHIYACPEFIEGRPSVVCYNTKGSTIKNKNDDSAFAGSFSFIKTGNLAALPHHFGKPGEQRTANYKLPTTNFLILHQQKIHL